MKKCKIKYMSDKCINRNCICEKLLKSEQKLNKKNKLIKALFEIYSNWLKTKEIKLRNNLTNRKKYGILIVEVKRWNLLKKKKKLMLDVEVIVEYVLMRVIAV